MKAILTITCCVVLLSCADLERTNPLDPKNPDSYRTRIVLAELFVNDSLYYTDSTYFEGCRQAELALDTLYQEFGPGRMVYAQYHVANTSPPDSYTVADHWTYYSDYITENGSYAAGVPDAFINGPAIRVQSADSYTDIYTRLKAEIEAELDRTAFFTLEGEMTVSNAGQSVSVSGTIARLGENSAADLYVNYIVLMTAPLAHQRYIAVKNIRDNIYINSLDAGETRDLPGRSADLDLPLPDISRAALLIVIKDSHKNVLQAELITGD